MAKRSYKENWPVAVNVPLAACAVAPPTMIGIPESAALHFIHDKDTVRDQYLLKNWAHELCVLNKNHFEFFTQV